MELEKLARQLGAAIQQDKTYLDYQEAMKKNEEDSDLNDLMGKIRLLQMNYQAEAQKEDADSAKLDSYQQEFQGIYAQIMANTNMQAFEKARQAVDDMMNYLTGILALCVNGEDPETCDPRAHMHDHDCGGECSTCGGCH
ncbi:MAG: YlbF family regulator [Clostridia bacterium]|nr:YlbF family regulator [Clostridia bacterium]